MTRDGRPRAWAAAALGAGLLAAAGGAAKEIPTTCADICDTLTATQCTVSSVHDVVPGSDIDCTSVRAINVNGGSLRVHDGSFTLRGKSLMLINGGTLVADCPQAFPSVGLAVRVPDDIVLVALGGPKIDGRCRTGGARVELAAGGNVTVAGNGIDVTGTDPTGSGGSGGEVVIDAGGTLTVNSQIAADATAGGASGGRLDLHGESVIVAATLSAQGAGDAAAEAEGGEIAISAEGDLSVTAGNGLLVTAGQGSGGTVALDAGGLVDLDKPIKAQGTGAQVGYGGAVTIEAEGVSVDADINASGGHDGGEIGIDARGGDITVGASGQAALLDARGNAGDAGGEIRLAARGSDVTIGPNGTIHATGAGTGGLIQLRGVGVTTQAGAALFANGAAPTSGGSIEVEARGALNLAGTIQANNQGSLLFAYRDGTPTIASGITGYELVALPDLPDPCGDGIRNAGTGGEACDGTDLGGATCASQGQGTGTLACTESCTFDYAGCSGS